MDKKCLDFEFKRYVKIVQSYLDELVDIEKVAACHAWLDKLSTYADTAQRNKYIFKLMYQLARGSLQEPFMRPPASEHLEIIPDGPDDKSDLRCPGADSLLTAEDKTTLGPDKSCETFTFSKETTNSERPNTLINIKTSNSTIEKRFKNIVMKLRHMKRENAILHQLLSAQEKYKNDYYCGRYFSGTIRETTTNLCPHFFEPGAWQRNGDHNINDTKIKMESTIVRDLDLPKFTNETELEIIKIYESKIFELTKQRSNSLDDLKQYYEKLLGRLQIAHDNNITEKEGIIKNKDEEIARLNKSIEEMKTRTLCKKFSIQNIEKRLSKIEISTSKHLKKYQRKILKQRQKYIYDCTLLLDLLQQKSIDDTKDNPIVPCTNHLKKLEDKYKNIVAKVQATALQRMIQDQLAMETLVKKISSISFVYNKTSQMNNVHNKTKSKIEDPKPHEPNGVEVNDQMELKNNEFKS